MERRACRCADRRAPASRGSGPACHLQTNCPGKTYAILEARDRMRRHLGPVPLSRDPLGLRHVHAGLLVPAVARGEVDRRRTRRSSATSATPRASTGSSAGFASTTASCGRTGRAEDARWTRRSPNVRPGETLELTCGFLFMCSGYYRYDEGYTPELRRDRASFSGRIVHPQHWTDDVDYEGKRVVVIGSGATAVTLVPALAAASRARDDAPALAELRGLAPGRGPDRRVAPPAAPGPPRLRARALEERAC